MALPQSYIRDKGRCASPIFIPGEVYQFYLNLDTPTSDPNFPFFRVDVLDRNGLVIAYNAGQLHKDVLAYGFYTMWISILFPAITPGQYRLQIFDTQTNTQKAISGWITVETSDNAADTAFVSYRNKYTRSSIPYDTNKTFYTKLRLALIETNYQFDSDRKQYRNVTDRRLRNIKSYKDELVTIESYYFTKDMHRAVSEMYEHDTIFINNVHVLPKTIYNRENAVFSALTKGTIDAILDESIPVPAEARGSQSYLQDNNFAPILDSAGDYIYTNP